MEDIDALPGSLSRGHQSDEELIDPPNALPPPKKPGSKGLGKKRTKTGCLTCRRRRIKCGEEKPICQNCIKSKRQCEGYNQRVVFKDPLSLYRGPPLSTTSQLSFVEPNSGISMKQSQDISPSQSLPVPGIAPRPGGSSGLAATGAHTSLGTTAPISEQSFDAFSTSTNIHVQPPIPAPKRFDVEPERIDQSYLPETATRHFPTSQPYHYDFDALTNGPARSEVSAFAARRYSLEWPAGSSVPPTFINTTIPQSASKWQTPVCASTSTFPPQNYGVGSANLHAEASQRLSMSAEDVSRRENTYFDTHNRGVMHTDLEGTPAKVNPGVPQGGFHSPVKADDELQDVSEDEVDIGCSDGECQLQDEIQDHHLKTNDLGIVVAIHAQQDAQDLALRSFNSFISSPNMLATYVPSLKSSPLSDSMTARIFCHFVNVSAPSISMFERHPANPSLIFQGQPIPKSQQHIWAYTIPTLALQNPALLHAILAIGSLHIAHLQNVPATASLKHYAIALRRVAKSVSLPTRRGQPETLAAALLLAFYECWGAEHQKWSSHLLGARQLLREIDFAGMTKYIKTMKLQHRREMHARHFQGRQGLRQPLDDDWSRHQIAADDVDENLVGLLMGKRLRYDQHGHVIDDILPDEKQSKAYTQRDLEIFGTQRDLYWWFCKQDVYQSMLGGGRLFMDYKLWSHCLPRSPVGRLNATYGSYDHVILLLGRLANFASKDLKRKRLAMKVNGSWRPPGEMRIPPQGTGQSQSSHQGPPNFPQVMGFAALIPNIDEPKLPMGFSSTRESPPQSASSDERDLETWTLEAEDEWQDIRNAFNILEHHFGEDFQALGPEFSTPYETPFGAALQYRTYGIAGIWMNYYIGLIACHRAHPSMPPASTMAAGLAARQTASYANEIGRIAAGIAPDCSMTTEVNPGVGAALIESSTCLFVAGIQYQNAAQRSWSVNRLRDIGRLTGWQTAFAIATGLETSWIKVFELGKGPPYTRTGEERKIPADWCQGRRVDKVLAGRYKSEGRLVVHRADRIHYALGVLGVEEDFEHLDLDNDEPNDT